MRHAMMGPAFRVRVLAIAVLLLAGLLAGARAVFSAV